MFFFVYETDEAAHIDEIISLLKDQEQIVKEKLITDRYVVSKSQASLAWMDQDDENACTQITVMSLEQGDTYTIQAQSGQKIKALGFMNEDLVYGIANDSDIVTDNAGNTVFAMNTVRIEQFGGGSGFGLPLECIQGK